MDQLETRVVMTFISAVKNSILKKIYTFSIAFLELTLSKKKLPFFFKRRKEHFVFLHSYEEFLVAALLK